MIQFARHKTSSEIRQQCLQQRLEIDDRQYRQGSDYITVRGGGAEIIYNTVNGHFFGTTPKGIKVDSDKTTYDHKPWMQALLHFFYVPKS